MGLVGRGSAVLRRRLVFCQLTGFAERAVSWVGRELVAFVKDSSLTASLVAASGALPVPI